MFILHLASIAGGSNIFSKQVAWVTQYELAALVIFYWVGWLYNIGHYFIFLTRHLAEVPNLTRCFIIWIIINMVITNACVYPTHSILICCLDL